MLSLRECLRSRSPVVVPSLTSDNYTDIAEDKEDEEGFEDIDDDNNEKEE